MALILLWVVIEDTLGLNLEWRYVLSQKDGICKNECESVRVCEQIREMCRWRDSSDMTIILHTIVKN